MVQVASLVGYGNFIGTLSEHLEVLSYGSSRKFSPDSGTSEWCWQSEKDGLFLMGKLRGLVRGGPKKTVIFSPIFFKTLF